MSKKPNRFRCLRGALYGLVAGFLMLMTHRLQDAHCTSIHQTSPAQCEFIDYLLPGWLIAVVVLAGLCVSGWWAYRDHVMGEYKEDLAQAGYID
ncbi:MAG TPA: hypothetical protein VN680_07475 [Burkholderiaceae bacterium]|jgi:H+/Cl- antiporter ClcA|nr:hypothetical protein [Burkholderiaceae bacterium]